MGAASPLKADPSPPPPLGGEIDDDRPVGSGLVALIEAQEGRLASFLRESILAIVEDRPKAGAEAAIKALEIDDRCGPAWHLLAVARERCDDFTSALKCFESALALLPEDPVLGHDLGRLAYRLGMLEVAEKLYAAYLAAYPDSPDAANNLAIVLRDQFRFQEAVAVVKAALDQAPASAVLWNTLGTIQAEQGDMERSLVFFEEALRLDPKAAKARYNRAGALSELGRNRLAVMECEAAIAAAGLESDIAMMKLARSAMLLAVGDLEGGWEAYEARHDPHYREALHFLTEAPLWTPEMDLEGKTLLIFGEQGIGDEILFASLLEDVQAAVGPQGRIILAVEKRLRPLLERSFPGVQTLDHITGKIDHVTMRSVILDRPWSQIDAWAPIGSLLRRFRRRIEDFPARPAFLKADPEAVARWRARLAELPGQKVGVVWKSGVKATKRVRYFARFEDWAPIFQTPGVSFITLQYGDAAEELAFARKVFGVEIWTPPGVDLKNDIDELSALTAALDLMIGPANAATNLSAALGVETWILTYPNAWTRLGSEHYPWYPSARAFTLDPKAGWGQATEATARALRARIARASPSATPHPRAR